MKISAVITIFNEVSTMSSLLDSLLGQTHKADEIIIVDGGSTDGSGKIVEDYAKSHPAIKLIIKNGNIAQGRNEGIRSAQNEIIAIIDAGCVAHPDWLEKLVEPFRDLSVGLSAGFYQMISSNDLSKAAAPFLGITTRKFDGRTFIPSARSMAFRKSVWEKVGGFNEDMHKAGEDTLFNYEVVKNDITVVRVPEALVDWMVPNTWQEIAHKFFSYALGDAETNIWWHPTKRFKTHNIKILTIYGRYLLLLTFFFAGLSMPFVFFMFICLLTTYLGWAMWKMKDDVSELQARAYVPIVQVVSDFAVMTGFFAGQLRKRLPAAL